MKVCEHSLRWVLNMRQALRMNPKLVIKENHNLLEKQLSKDGHSHSSFYWTLNQVHQIEKNSFEKWLISPGINYNNDVYKVASCTVWNKLK